MLCRIILTGILATTLLSAQHGGGRRGGEENTANAPFVGNSRLDRMADALKLTKDQKKGMKATFDEAQKESAPVYSQLMKGRQAIAEAVAAGKSQDEITQLVHTNSVLDAQIASIELKAFSTIYKSLDEDQHNRPVLPMIFRGMKGMFGGKSWNSLD